MSVMLIVSEMQTTSHNAAIVSQAMSLREQLYISFTLAATAEDSIALARTKHNWIEQQNSRPRSPIVYKQFLRSRIKMMKMHTAVKAVRTVGPPLSYQHI